MVRHMSEAKVNVLIAQVSQRMSIRLLFGSPELSERLTISHASACRLRFVSGQVVGLSRRRMNDYGTTHHEVIAFRCPAPGDDVTVINGVKPGGIVLLHTTGANADRALRIFELAEELGIDLAAEEALLRDLDVRLNGRVYPERFLRRFVEERRA